MLSPIILTVIGILVAVLGFFIISKQLESAIFWSILLGPAVGNAIIGCITNLVEGNYELAVSALAFLPCFLGAIDASFFAPEVEFSFMIFGGITLLLWVYVLSHFASKRFGIWALPMMPLILYLAGSSLPELGMPNLRATLSNAVPVLSPLLLPFHGLPMLAILTLALFGISYFTWHRGYTMAVSLPDRLKIGK